MSVLLADRKWSGFQGRAELITEEQIARAAKHLGVKWSRLHGIMEVEAAFREPGDGFDAYHRPKMLFEPHHFYRALKIRKPAALPEAVQADLARPSRPPTTWYGKRSYLRLVQAIELDEVSGLLACSWGFGQVMGFNWKMAGFTSVEDMVRRCMDSEEAHLLAMCGYIRSANLVEAINRGDAEAFASGYNGVAGVGAYAPKIRRAWANWERRPFPAPMPKAKPPLVAPPQRAPEVSEGRQDRQDREDAMPAETLPPETPTNLQPKPGYQSKSVQGLAMAAAGLAARWLAGKLFPNQEGASDTILAVLLTYGPDVLTALGVAWASVGAWVRSQPLAGSEGARKVEEAVKEIQDQCAAIKREHEAHVQSHDAGSADLSTRPLEEIIPQIPGVIERLRRMHEAVDAIYGGPALPPPEPRPVGEPGLRPLRQAEWTDPDVPAA